MHEPFESEAEELEYKNRLVDLVCDQITGWNGVGVCAQPLQNIKETYRAAMASKTLLQLEADRLEWSLATFTEATPVSSLRKLEGEIKEVEADLLAGDDPTEEYADCLMCLFDSAGRAGIRPAQIVAAFALKLAKNKARVWSKNDDNSYSHVK